MKTLKIKRSEVIFLTNVLSQLKGIKNFKKTISIGHDIRVLKNAQKDIEEALKICKPEKFDELLDEFRKLKAVKAKEMDEKAEELHNDEHIGQHVLLMWPKAHAWIKANKDYQEAQNNVLNEEIEIELHTESFEEKDFEKKPSDATIGEALSYFMKE